MPRQTTVRAFLYYLRHYLEADKARKKRLLALHRKLIGAEIDSTTLWRHLTLRKEPFASTFLVYQIFLMKEKQSTLAPNNRLLNFTYTNRAILKKKKA